jgi:acyl-coenzyme A synthetase/AMP-(fatty) acid ligase
VAGIRPGGLCIFAADDRGRGMEEVVLVAEVAEGVAKAEGLAEELRKTVGESTGCRPDRVILVPPHTLPKTSSGKIQRFKARQWYLDGTLEGRGGERRTSGLWFYLKARLFDLLPFGRP